jgi:hypothetical protein
MNNTDLYKSIHVCSRGRDLQCNLHSMAAASLDNGGYLWSSFYTVKCNTSVNLSRHLSKIEGKVAGEINTEIQRYETIHSRRKQKSRSRT